MVDLLMEFKALLWSRFDHKSRKFAYVIFLLICIIKSYDLPSVKLWDELKVKLYGMYKYRKYDTSIWWHEICWKMHLWKFIRTNTLHISNLLLKIDNPHKNLKVMTSKIGPELRQKILYMNPEGFELVQIKHISSELYQN